ncbi:MAG: phosphatase PAP2 family protein [Flavobacteriaceae bacterium CG2_30_31_66]|nr:MAG: phosphatase PAP2 family protein [Flavobacteriaceae bacterium CG2_30_31_66]
MIEFLIKKDRELLIFLNNLGSEQWDPFWLFITKQFYWTPLFLLLFYLIFKSFGLKKGGFVILSIIVLITFSDQFTNFVKDYFGRLRPNNDPSINYLLRSFIQPQSFSFTSGHATTSSFFSIFIILLLKENYKNIYFLLLFPLIFGYSRIYLGVHFPLDILFGFFLGTFLAIIYFKIFKKIFNKLFD